MIHEKTFTIRQYRNWNHTIFAAIQEFIRLFEKVPHIILTNDVTARRIDIAMSTEIVAEGLVDEFRQITQFASKLGVMDFCQDPEIATDDFVLIHDADAEFVDTADEIEDVSAVSEEKRRFGS